MEIYKEAFAAAREEIFSDYFAFLRFPSIATDPHYQADVHACCEWLADYMKKSGLTVEIWETEGAPILFANDLRAGPEKETLLLYGHYDVQPVDPVDDWSSPPFEPTVREGEVYARGAVDNKGQCFYTAVAIATYLKLHRKLPLNLKLLIEGEEESGSRNLSHILEEKKEALKADYLLIVDSGTDEKDVPAITLGGRGIVCMEMSVEEADFDLHSGIAGGIAYNPNRALVEMLAKLHDETGRVTVPGFYDAIFPLTDQERSDLDFLTPGPDFRKEWGFDPIAPIEDSLLKPTLEINGIWGGYIDAGVKTVIPAKAHAKLSCRLVPDQEPQQIAQLVHDYLLKLTPKGLHTTVTIFPGSGKGFRTSPHDQLAKLASRAYSDVFEKPCKQTLIGGTIPIAVDLAEAAEAEMVMIGLGLPSDRVHSPDEHFGLDRFEKGFLTICRTIELFET